MHTIFDETGVRAARRRKHSPEFKAQVVAACKPHGVSIAAVAMAHGINANLARRWVVQATQSAGNPMVPGAAMVPGAVAPAFIPVHQPPAEPAPADIRIELRRGTTAISVSWPCEAAAQCAAWMRELLR